MTPHDRAVNALARRIARDLFTNGAGNRAVRLHLEMLGGRDGGRWGERPAANQIARVLRRAKLIRDRKVGR